MQGRRGAQGAATLPESASGSGRVFRNPCAKPLLSSATHVPRLIEVFASLKAILVSSSLLSRSRTVCHKR